MSELLPGRQGPCAVSLLDDEDVSLAVGRRLGREILAYQGIVYDMPREQLLCLLSMAGFADSADECSCVAGMVVKLLKKADILPLVTEHKGMELAARCLISLGIFMKAMVERTSRTNAPPPHFYRSVGRNMLVQKGRTDVAEHFRNWEAFLQELFVIG